MTSYVRFNITSGLPFSKVINITFPTGRSWWTNTSQFELLFQIREHSKKNSPLILDMRQFLTASFINADLLRISLSMTGANTRLVTKSGYYDLVISDVGVTDARAYVVIKGNVTQKSLVTAEQVNMP